MFDPTVVLSIALTFLVAGTVKGIVGSGLPTIAVGVLTTILGLHSAIALMLVPTIVTNVWQALVGGHFRKVVARVWPFLLMAALTIWIGVAALARVNVLWLSGLLGFLLALYGLMGLLRPPWSLAPENRTWVGVIGGCISGVLGGMTGSFGIPGIPYMQAVGFPRDELIQALGILFSLSTISLAIALTGHGLLSPELEIASALALIPTLAGMAIGQLLRKRLSEALFRKIFFLSQIALGSYVVLHAAGL